MFLVTFSPVSFAEASSFTCYINVYQDSDFDFSSVCFPWLPWLPPQPRRERFWSIYTSVSLLSTLEGIRHFQLTVWKQPQHDQNLTQYLPPRPDMSFLLFFYLEKKATPSTRYQVINISTWRDFLDSFLSVTLYLPQPDYYIFQFCQVCV